MNASLVYYKSLKAYDPIRELWTSLVIRSSEDNSLSSWSKQEVIYFSTCLLEGELYNGGFDQYFYNSSSDYYRYAIDGLGEIGALRSLEIVQEAANTLFGRCGPPSEQADRWRIMNSKTRRFLKILFKDRKGSHLERLDKEFWTDPDQLGDRLNNYAKDQGLVIPFENRTD